MLHGASTRARAIIIGVGAGVLALMAAPPVLAKGSPTTTRDRTPPTIAISSPGNGSSVSGTVSMFGSASDNVGVQAIAVSVDGGAFNAASGTTSWSYTWNSTTAPNGSHTLTARATDTSGRASTAAVTVTVANTVSDTTAPTVAMTAPGSGSTVSGSVGVAGTASDASGVNKVEVSVDSGPWAMAAGTSNWSWTWATTSAANGSHTIAARATDTAGNTSTTTRTVTVSNQAADTTAPVVAVTSPSNGATVSGSVAVAGTSSDNTSIAQVAVRIDGGSFVPASGTSSWTWTWNTTSATNGSHTVTARATDAAGNVSTATVTVSVNNSSVAPATQGSWVSPEGVTINVATAGSWTISQIYSLLTANALDLAEIGPRLTVDVQDQYASSTTSSAVFSGGVYSSYLAKITLKGNSSSFASTPDRVVAHEYGHAWSMYHLYMSHNGDWSSYLGTRWTASDGSVVLANDSRLDSSYPWTRGEIIADDYRLLFGTAAAINQGPTHMNTAIVDPRNQAGLRNWFLQQWAA